MASGEEKNSIIQMVGQYHDVEWPWNKLTISKKRKEAVNLIHNIGNNSDAFITSMIIFHQLITEELIEIYGTSGHYDEQDGGKLSAVLLVTDNFILNPKKDTAITLHDLIMGLDEDIYVPELSKYHDMEANIHNDVR